MRFPIAFKLMLTIFLLAAALVGTLVTLSYEDSYRELEDKFGLTLKHIAITAAQSISGDENCRILKPGDEKKPEFLRIRAFLERVMRENFLTYDTIYTFCLPPAGKPRFAVMLHPKPFVGDEYTVPPANQKYFDEVRAGRPVNTRLYEDAHGYWISGLAPLVTAAGKVEGLLEVDFRVDKFLDELVVKRNRIALIGGGIGLLGLLVSVFVGRAFARPIRVLKAESLKIIQGDYDVRIALRSRDELGDLAATFNLMGASLAERFHMLKYVSRHTVEMINRLQRGEIRAEGELRGVTIFFSDVRGFTAYSEHRAPAEVIARLNRLLGVQADLVDRHGGQVDKFVGDEVVAVFTGPDRDRDALRAGIAVQRAVAALNAAAGDGPLLEVGVGIASGDVIFGNIGSDDRKDYTIIGANVNLAARLCANAPAGAILCTSDVFRAAQRAGTAGEPYVLAEEPPLSVKGFTAPIHVYRAMAAAPGTQA